MRNKYKITPYSYKQAKRLGVEIQPSSVSGKKIDVFKNSKKVASIGAIGYKDFPTYKELEKKGIYPIGHAEKRRKLYKIRHNSTRKIKNTPSYYSDQILW